MCELTVMAKRALLHVFDPFVSICKNCKKQFTTRDGQLVIMIIVIPLPLFFAQTIYGVRGLEAWVIIGIIWTFSSAFTVVIYPLYESREALFMVSKGVLKVRVLPST